MSRRYRQPPVVHAACEVRFAAGSPWDLATPGLIYERLKDSFPKRQAVKSLQTKLTGTPEGVLQELVQADLLRFLNEEGTTFIQAGKDVISAHQQDRYAGWVSFQPQIDRAVTVYREVTAATEIERIGLRYVNRVRIRGAAVDLEQYYNFFPQIGAGLPQVFGAYHLGVEFGYDEGTDVLRLQLTAAPSDNPEVNTSELDLDYFLAKPGRLEANQIMPWLQTAHSRVEEVFEACIKDSLREMFGEVEDQ